MTSARPNTAPRSQDSERRCLVTGETHPKAEMIRFVVGPDALLIPDLSHNLPGRGLWVTAEAAHLETAGQKNLFSKAAKTQVRLAPDWLGQLRQLQQKRCLNFLGLAKKSGVTVLGQTQVESALRAGALRFLLIAHDASDKGVQDVLRLAEHAEISPWRGFDRHAMGAALGYHQVVYAGLTADPVTQKIAAELACMDKINGTSHFTQRNG